jgi:large subunit ribosomal protein L21
MFRVFDCDISILPGLGWQNNRIRGEKMYAIIELQGFQEKVEKGDKIVVNRLKDQESKTVKVDKVLFGRDDSGIFVGQPYVEGAYVECEVIGDKRLKKVISFKYRDRKSSQSKKGHRQDVTELKIKEIHLGGAKTSKKTKQAAE